MAYVREGTGRRKFTHVGQAAIAALNTLQSNFAVVDAIRRSGRGMNKDAIPEMIEWCRRIGYEVRHMLIALSNVLADLAVAISP